jgi:hypothetical protein
MIFGAAAALLAVCKSYLGGTAANCDCALFGLSTGKK